MHRSAYRGLVHVVHRLPFLTGKVARSVAGRREARKRWVAWSATRADGPLVWFHAASVGEMLTAEPVAWRLRAARPALQVVLSYSSPSVARWGRPGFADHADYAPLDEPSPVAEVIDAVRPQLLAFSRGDLWPELMQGALQRDIPIALTGARVSAGSGRLRWPVRRVLAPLAARVAHAGAVGLEDAGRLRAMGVSPEVLRISGDPRHDYVIERHVDLTLAASLARWHGGLPTIVAGSVEPPDERPLLEGLMPLVAQEACRVCVVPHDPGAAERIARHWSAAGLAAALWSGPPASVPDVPVVFVTRFGALFDLYAAGDMAFVGGAFGRGGLHAVIEPAALGLPVAFGPQWDGDPDGAALVAEGGGVSVGTPAELRDGLHRWIRDESARIAAGMAARRTLRPGAAGEDAAALLDLLRQRTLR